MPDLNVNIKATDKTSKAFTAVKGNVNGLKGSFTKMMGPLTAIVGVAGLAGMAKNLLTVGDRMGKVSTQLGIGTGALQTYQFAAEQAGLSSNSMNTALQKLTRNIGEAKDGTLAQQEAFDALDVSLTNTDGSARDVESIFLDVTEAIKNTKDVTEKARIASDLFGRSGVELLVVLDEGKEGFKTMGEELKSLGGIMSQEGIDNIQQFNDRLNALSKIGRTAFSELITVVNQAITRIIIGIDKTQIWLGMLVEPDAKKSLKELNEEWDAIGVKIAVNNDIIHTQAGLLASLPIKEHARKNTLDAINTAMNDNLVLSDRAQDIITEINVREGKHLDLTKLVKKEQTTVTKEVEKQDRFFAHAVDGVTKIGHVSKETLNTLGLEGDAYNVLTKEQSDMLTHAVALEKVEIAKAKIQEDALAKNQIKMNAIVGLTALQSGWAGRVGDEIKIQSEEFDGMVGDVGRLTQGFEDFQTAIPESYWDRYWDNVIDKSMEFWGITDTEVSAFQTNLETAKTFMSDLWESSGVGGFFGEFGGDIMSAGGKSGARAQNVTEAFSKGPTEGIMALVLSNEKVQEALAKVFDAIFALVDPIIDLLAPVLDVLVEVIKELNPLIEILLPPIRALLQPVKAVITWVQALVAGFVSVVKFLANVGGSLGVVSEAIGSLLEGFGVIETVFKNAFGEDSVPVKALQALKVPLELLKDAVGFLMKAVDALFSPINSLVTAFDSFKDAVDVGGSDSILSSPGTWLKNRTGIDFGRFQEGGFAKGGTPIIVGEKGPEIFTPSAGGGTVTPNDKLGGGVVVNIYSDVGRKISESEAGIRVAIEDRANRNNQFPALLS